MLAAKLFMVSLVWNTIRGIIGRKCSPGCLRSGSERRQRGLLFNERLAGERGLAAADLAVRGAEKALKPTERRGFLFTTELV